MKPEQKDYTNHDVLNVEMHSRDWKPKPTTRSARAELLQSDYPYLDLGSGFSRTLSSLKQMTSSINPFAIQQGSTHERLGFAPFVGSKWWVPSPLPNDVTFSRMGPSHYDASTQSTFSPPDPSHVTIPLETWGNVHVGKEPIPLSCVRPLQKFYRCKMINSDDKCQEEANNFLALCPNPVLGEMRNDKLMKEKHRQIQLADYRRAIQVSEYNKDRTIANVPYNVNKSMGTRHNLRPDTLWADERYSNVTFEEIQEARAKLGEQEKRVQVRLNPQIQKIPHFDSNKQFVKKDDMPVYVK